MAYSLSKYSVMSNSGRSARKEMLAGKNRDDSHGCQCGMSWCRIRGQFRYCLSHFISVEQLICHVLVQY